ncbi:MAG: lamin tail domain-containing protein [Oscillospiraceae bacterium]|jgi:hypothetical protein|nr:lamin tail domain-containing protein [Oscillospiraceae bacterium]
MTYIRKTRMTKEYRRRTIVWIASLAAALCAMLALSMSNPGAEALPASGSALYADGSSAFPIIVSELMSSNGYAVLDDGGRFSDWIELRNISSAPVSLQGMGLSDKPGRIKYLFPDVTLEPDGYLLVFASGTAAADPSRPLHAPFELSALGEMVCVFDPNGVMRESVEFPAMAANESYALTEDGGFIRTSQYSPGYPNTREGYESYCAQSGAEFGFIKLNEISPRNRAAIIDEDGDASDWIELINERGYAVSLEGYALSDNESRLSKWVFPKGATIPANGVLLVFASGKDRADPNGELHANFRIDGEREAIMLANPRGQLVDHTVVERTPKDASWARSADLSSWSITYQATPGEPNTRQGEIDADASRRLSAGGGLTISEAIAYTGGSRTPDGLEGFDWVEIYNGGGGAVNLAGYGLSDQPGRPRLWQFPDVTIQPGQFLLVYLSGSERLPDSSQALYAPFGISSLGEALTLSDPDGNVIDRLAVPALVSGTSYGRIAGGGLAYFDIPTPGERNGEGFAGYAAVPTVDIPGGMYPAPIEATVRAAAGTTVRYTVDGSNPTIDSPEYTGPVPIEHTAVFRARAFQDGLRPSPIVTNTYFISVYHLLPVVSIVADPYLLWNPLTGIYAGDYTQSAMEKMPFTDMPYWQKARVAAHFEYIDESGKLQSSEGVELSLNGQFSLDMPQKSFRVSAKARYGSEALSYPFFPELPYERYRALILRNGGQDGNYTRIVDAFQSRVMDWSGTSVYHMPSAPVVVYLNGEYWGHYNLRERTDKYALAQYEGWDDPDSVDLIKGSGTVISGTIDAYRETRNYIRDHNMNDPASLARALEMIDVDNLFDFYIFEIYFGNSDAGNIKYYRRNAPGEKWRWIVFDLDWGMFDSSRDGCAIWLDPDGAGSLDYDNVIIRQMLSVPRLKDQFLKRYGHLFQTVFVPERMLELAGEMSARIEPEMTMHFNRWAMENSWALGTDAPKSPEGAFAYWKDRLSRLDNVIRKRNHLAWGHVQSWFKLTDAEMESYFGPRPPLPEGI